ncbi:hypothetical protein JCM30237_11160 [Halolamina litorea]|uniref:Holin n=1 Tax=Halolamina litorea TaxID=1515593 RepID=A0ABD6BMQ7_9EURY|nr:hypothetical protein [Halolamina litorea]
MALLSNPASAVLNVVIGVGALIAYYRHGLDREGVHRVAGPTLAAGIAAIGVLELLPNEPRWLWLGVGVVTASAFVVEVYTGIVAYFAPIVRHYRPFRGR